MGFTLGVENAPSPATQWMAQCNNTTTGVPRMTGPLPLAQRWSCTEAAPGLNALEIACFGATGSIVQESMVQVTIEDGYDYTFDFATQSLLVVGVPSPQVSQFQIADYIKV